MSNEPDPVDIFADCHRLRKKLDRGELTEEEYAEKRRELRAKHLR